MVWFAIGVALGACGGEDPVPVAHSQTLVVQEDDVLEGTVSATDLLHRPIAYSLTAGPSHGVLTLEAETGRFSYRPLLDFQGQDAFRFAAHSGTLASEPATVSIAVHPVNDAPIALGPAARYRVDQAHTVDQVLEVPENGVLGGAVVAIDVDSPLLVYRVVEPPLYGTLDLEPLSGTFTYCPVRGYSGPDAFRFVAADGATTSAPGTVSISVVNDPPVAQELTIELDEDTGVTTTLQASDRERDPLTFAITEAPRHGAVELDGATGALTYRPSPSFSGQDAFRFTVSDGKSTAAGASVTVTVRPVNDAPEIAPLPDAANSAETRETFLAVRAIDVDGDPLYYTVAVADPAIATAAVDATGTIALTPRAQGATPVEVVASDGELQAKTTFTFTVGDATKLRRWTVDEPRAHAVSIHNTLDREASFELRHNGALLAVSGHQLVDEVRALPDEVLQEAFERKLWRYLRDGTYHYDPLTSGAWGRDPLLYVNSIGFGYCGMVAAAYTSLAHVAGMAARTWELTGHVVPEVNIGGRWLLLDPDLAVYYTDGNGAVLGVEDLAAEPGLVANPFDPVASWSTPYLEYVADLYATTTNNIVLSDAYNPPPFDRGALLLPPGARVTYPGRWSPEPVGYWGSPVAVSAQIRVDLPPGFTGRIDWPLVPWDVQGVGRVRVGNQEFAAGSADVAIALRNFEGGLLGHHVDVLESGGLGIVYLLNPLRFEISLSTEVAIRSLDAWALDVDLVPLSQGSQLGYDSTASVRRPR